MASELLERCIAAHGGRALWEGASEVSLRLSSGGLAFASKLQGHAVRDVHVRIATQGQHVVFDPYPRAGHIGVLDHDGSIRIETSAGDPVDVRERPREAFADLRHKLWWDRLDILYFGTYAIWTYLSTPFVLAREGYGCRELGPWEGDGERLERLAVTFPAGVHTHSREQVFHINEAGLIRRHDYTAEPVGGWAKAANYCRDHETFDGLVVPTTRRVYPRKKDGHRRSWPRLVWIDVPSASVR